MSKQFQKINSLYLYFGNKQNEITTNEDITNDDIIGAFYKNFNFIFSVPSKRNSKIQRKPTSESNINSIQDSVISDFIQTAVIRDRENSISSYRQNKYFSSSSSSEEDNQEELEDNLSKSKSKSKSISSKFKKKSSLTFDDNLNYNENDDTNYNTNNQIIKEEKEKEKEIDIESGEKTIKLIENDNSLSLSKEENKEKSKFSDKKLSADFRNLFRIFRINKGKGGKFKTLLDEFQNMFDLDEIIDLISQSSELKLEMNVLEKIQFPYFKNVNLVTEFNTETISNFANQNLTMVNYGKYLKEMKMFFLIWSILLIVTEIFILISY